MTDAPRPTVTLKTATSLDGRIATASGESKWITCEAAREEVHRLRAAHDAVLVGSQTLIDDDPALTVRLPGYTGPQPLRVVADARLRTPIAARLFASSAAPVLLVHAELLHPSAALEWLDDLRRLRPSFDADEALSMQGSPVGSNGRGIAPAGLLNAIQGNVGRRRFQAEMKRAKQERSEARGFSADRVDQMRSDILQRQISVLLEGGGKLAASFLRAGLIDRIEWFRAPIVLGGDGRPALAALELAKLVDAPRFKRLDVRAVGDDLWERYERLP
jgi:diaminohydroxyphosphoribosylaminopyrimidine deaminase/5-amino-6-(5-phosphoribosylamino)uracil reductase